ncbi:hypothetical protein ETB97_003804 [Aspergillus alliaceus]|uniref:Zn(2)-C6 fungal-type domain-containing protein n=1 Tax=Petromyces alliaceus TaxID=209559 RepID=A0A8H6E584_PETAA|nr:hypothetical protein ETB97_003804 [Aspergillus burnettii]
MNSLSRRKACNSCIKGKRRCDLQHPACGRCVTKGVHCEYRSTRLHDPPPTSSPACQDQDYSLTDIVGPVHTDTSSSGLLYPFALTGYPLLPLGHLSEIFLSPDSWSLVRRISTTDQAFDASSLIKIVRTIQQWLKQWVLEGSTLFIHPHLYPGRLPSCLQDAYTSAAAYFLQNPSNKDITNPIIEERVSELLAEPTPSSLTDHLARVQALLVYQIICLFDGDDHQRSIAERRIPTLISWSSQMLECARISSEYIQLAQSGHGPQEPRQEALWKAWILGESVRRTWMIRTTIVAVYELLKWGRTSCAGGVKFTARAGLWEAPTAQRWVAACQQQDVLFLSGADANRLFVQTRPNEVDVFVHFILTVIFGLEAVVTWVRNTGYSQTGTTEDGLYTSLAFEEPRYRLCDDDSEAAA